MDGKTMSASNDKTSNGNNMAGSGNKVDGNNTAGGGKGAAARDLPYRPCAGIMLINSQGLVWAGQRIPKWDDDASAHIWQMPQGGIDAGEEAGAAAIRELEEETGVTSIEILAESRDWLHYDLPDDLIGTALKGKYRGQKQKWFAMRFLGDESEIDISARNGHKAEFSNWKWERAANLPDLIVPFKRPIYSAIIEEFKEFIA